jgi:hypothetical protein
MKTTVNNIIINVYNNQLMSSTVTKSSTIIGTWYACQEEMGNNYLSRCEKNVTRKLASNVTAITVAVPNEQHTDSNVTVSKQYRMDLYLP